MTTALRRLATWLSDLRLAIVLLLLIAGASAVGTHQGDPPASCRCCETPGGAAPWSTGASTGLDRVQQHWFAAAGLAWSGSDPLQLATAVASIGCSSQRIVTDPPDSSPSWRSRKAFLL